MGVTESVSSSRPDIAAAMGYSAESLYEKCSAIASNLWWSWHHEAINVFRDLDPIAWRKLDHNPIALLAEFTPERLEARAAEMVLHSRINHAYRQLKEYLAEKPLWGKTHIREPLVPSPWPTSHSNSVFTSRCRSTREDWGYLRVTT
jgi:starch phosphorylase